MRNSVRTSVRCTVARSLLTAILVVAAACTMGCASGRQTSTSLTTAPAPASTTTAASLPGASTTLAEPTTLVQPGTTSSVSEPPTTATTTPAPIAPLAFDSAEAMIHVKELATDIGIRPGGSPAEEEAAAYAAEYLRGLGYDPVITEVPLPNGKTSHNVTVVKEGASPLTITVGGHLDSKKTTPGGNDDASGAAGVLELARDVVGADMTPTIVFVLFGTEEIIDTDKSHHHYGSRSYVKHMTATDREDLAAMISLDMIGYGQTFHVRTMLKGPQALRDMLQDYAAQSGLDLVYLRDTGPTGWSDHEPFELAGYPAVWLQWLEDPTYHQAGDTYKHCRASVVQTSGDLVLGFLTDISEQELQELRDAVRQ